MRIQSTPSLPTTPAPAPRAKPPQEKWDSVTFDDKTDTYHFERPGHHYSASRNNPLREGLVGAALVGVPSALGAAQNSLMGGIGATAATVLLSPTTGALIGGVSMGVLAYKGSNENLLYGGLGALAGAGVGTIAFPLLKLPGVWGGATGALVATAGVGVGVAIWAAVNNAKLDQKAIDAGYKLPT